MATTRSILAFTLGAAGLAACSHFQPTARPLYPGPARPMAEVARLSGPVATVDGVAVPDKVSLFALLPGCHVVELQPKVGEGSVSGAWSAEIRHRVYALKMQAGSSYEIDVRLLRGNTSLGSGTVGGVKIEAIERDAHGAIVGTLAPVRNQAEAAACRASAEGDKDQEDQKDQNDRKDQKPHADVTPPRPASAPASVPESQQDLPDQR